MREPTDEMVQLAVKTFLGAPGTNIVEIDAAMRAALTQVLAIVERDQAGACQVDLPSIVGGSGAWCQLRHGHLGDHTNGVTRWREAPPAAKWRCNTTERCFREDGHSGPHGFAGQAARTAAT